MKIAWHGHSCFQLTSGEYSIVMDPYYFRSVIGYPELHLVADEVLCSHEHFDHNHREAVSLRALGASSPFEIETIDTFHDMIHGNLRGNNTVHILRAEGLKIVHLGDLGCPLTPEQKEIVMQADVLMIPVGGILTIDASQAYYLCEAVKPRVIMPMHFGGNGLGNRRLHPPEEFLCSYEDEFVRHYVSGSMEIDGNTPKQIALFK